ncbi:MAG: N-acetylmuramoyl-L-alanine amidase [Acidobacteriaceae bacterium]|nr:N-acetylmuramoyl-L-alanine amidase [Acidobacteriaceae bacterium]
MFRLPQPMAKPALGLALLCASALAAEGQARVEAVRYWSFGDVTRIAIQTHGDYTIASDQIENPWRVYFDLTGLRPPATVHRGIQTILVKDRLVKQIRIAEVTPSKTRVVFDVAGPVEITSSQLVNPDRLMIEIRPKGASLPGLSVAHSVTGSQRVDLSAAAPTPVMEIAALPDAQRSATTSSSSNPVSIPSRVSTIQRSDGLVVQQTVVPAIGASVVPASPPAPLPAEHPAMAPPAAPPVAAPAITSKVVGVAAPAKRDSAGDRSLVRVFGLKLGKVVIDAGHGGHDTGTIGPNGLMEKDLVLDVATRLGKLITQQLGTQVVYTRSDDTFIPLENRTQIANNEKADLFISIHANSSPESSATGVETYFFNLTSDKSGLDLASRENATSASSISDLNDLLHKAVLQTKLEESREFAQRVQSSLWACSLRMNSRSRDRGVRQAPFVVLIGATMPSILAEIGFVSNPHDEKLLRRAEERQKIADALFKGVSQYATSLSHVQIARARSQ